LAKPSVSKTYFDKTSANILQLLLSESSWMNVTSLIIIDFALQNHYLVGKCDMEKNQKMSPHFRQALLTMLTARQAPPKTAGNSTWKNLTSAFSRVGASSPDDITLPFPPNSHGFKISYVVRFLLAFIQSNNSPTQKILAC